MSIQRDPSLLLTGLAQLLERYLHVLAHLFVSQAEVGKDVLRRKGSQEYFAKVLCSSSRCYQQLGVCGGGRLGPWIIPWPTIYMRTCREETEATSSLRKLFPLSLPTQSPLPPPQVLSSPLPRCQDAADSSC